MARRDAVRGWVTYLGPGSQGSGGRLRIKRRASVQRAVSRPSAGFRGRTFLRTARPMRSELDGICAVRADVLASFTRQPGLRVATAADTVRTPRRAGARD